MIQIDILCKISLEAFGLVTFGNDCKFSEHFHLVSLDKYSRSALAHMQRIIHFQNARTESLYYPLIGIFALHEPKIQYCSLEMFYQNNYNYSDHFR